jgi:hypothetical protein
MIHGTANNTPTAFDTTSLALALPTTDLPELRADAPYFRRATARLLVLVGLAAWAFVSAGGFLWLTSYAATPGTASVVEPTWPQESRVVPDSARANLILLVHPHCPCSRASLAELHEIMTRCEGLVTSHVLFLKPSQMPEGWEVTELWRRAAAIPGVRVWLDRDGSEARRFGAETSGQVVLYDRQGDMKFRGGITIARGHQGESTGRRAIVAWLTGGTVERSSEAVFGCPLFDSGSATVGLAEVNAPANYWRVASEALP